MKSKEIAPLNLTIELLDDSPGQETINQLMSDAYKQHRFAVRKWVTDVLTEVTAGEHVDVDHYCGGIDSWFKTSSILRYELGVNVSVNIVHDHPEDMTWGTSITLSYRP